MFEVGQSSSGQYVVVHQPTATYVVGDDLQAAFDRARAEVGDEGTTPPAATAAPAASGGLARWLGIGLLALLPFVWLGAMHVSLGRLAADLRAGPQAPPPALDDLRARIDRLEQQLDHLGRARPAAKPKPPPRAPAEAADEPEPPPAAPAEAVARPVRTPKQEQTK